MPAPATLDEFLLLVQRSGLVEDDRLDAFLRQLDATRALPADPLCRARALMRLFPTSEARRPRNGA